MGQVKFPFLHLALAARQFTLQSPMVLPRFKRTGRLLLVLIAFICAVTPYTEYLWSWDGFARGGEDMELGLMMFVAVLCLALVLFGNGRRAIRHLFQFGSKAGPEVALFLAAASAGLREWVRPRLCEAVPPPLRI